MTWRLLAALALVVAGVVSLLVMQAMDRAESRHLARSVVQQATVRTANNDDGDVGIELPDGSRHQITPYDHRPLVGVLRHCRHADEARPRLRQKPVGIPLSTRDSAIGEQVAPSP